MQKSGYTQPAFYTGGFAITPHYDATTFPTGYLTSLCRAPAVGFTIHSIGKLDFMPWTCLSTLCLMTVQPHRRYLYAIYIAEQIFRSSIRKCSLVTYFHWRHKVFSSSFTELFIEKARTSRHSEVAYHPVIACTSSNPRLIVKYFRTHNSRRLDPSTSPWWQKLLLQ